MQIWLILRGFIFTDGKTLIISRGRIFCGCQVCKVTEDILTESAQLSLIRNSKR